SFYQSLVPDLKMDFSIWVVGGLLLVTGTVWTLIYNADAILGGVMWVFGRIRSIAPVLKTSIATPLRNRFRTGTTLAMFTLVVFTLVVGSTTSNSFMKAANDKRSFGGGFDIRAETLSVNPIKDPAAAFATAPGVDAKQIVRVASESMLAVEAHQVD